VLRVGLTGGIGSGKSTVAGMLVDAGAVLIDADAISRSLTCTGGAAIGAILKQFGPGVVSQDGSMNRQAMRDLAFNDPAIKLQLEAIIHPLVGEACDHQARAALAAGKSCAVFDIPLLVESGRWRSRLDCVVVVDCLESTQIKRVMQRSNWAAEAVEKVIAAQATRAQRLAAADMVIYNDGLSVDELRALVRQLLPRLKL
jgi:dephospho-CoA kinase